MITVVGAGTGALAAHVRERIATAPLVVGAPRHLAGVPAACAGQTMRLSGDLRPVMDAIGAIEEAGGAPVVLASGDPGFFGVVRALAERFGRERLDVVPGVSSVALAFARAGVSWDDALVVSAHGRDPRSAVNVCRAHPKVAVLTSPSFGPADLAGELGGLARRFLVAERLGEAAERVAEGDADAIAAGTWADPNVVVVLDEARPPATPGESWPRRWGPDRWALPDAAFEHRAGMVTKAEVRALGLAALGPGLGDLVWDVGAGSGSVGIECARHGAAVIAVERDPEACDLVARNAARHRVEVHVVEGEAPAALASLPDPDAVFVGGGGASLGAVLEVVARRARRAVVVALAAVERVGPAVAALEAGGLAAEGVLLQVSRLSVLGTEAAVHRLAPVNPVFVVQAFRP
jgi:precorrin-6B C5,15-methyltransferase / cobalt-precorrin-6B C5,C15-methyltransferase